MERTLDHALDDLKKLILSMGGYVENALQHAMTAVVKKDPSQFPFVHEIEKKINECHIQVDNVCLSILAKQGPVARDLRLILSVIKINTDLERMGDQCVNISHTGKDYFSRAPLTLFIPEIQRMFEVARQMVTSSLDSFVRGDLEQAREILKMDDELDQLKNKIFKEVQAHMKANSQDVETGLDLILIARNLERLGDHATNIAEDVIFAYTGKDVRHGGSFG